MRKLKKFQAIKGVRLYVFEKEGFGFLMWGKKEDPFARQIWPDGDNKVTIYGPGVGSCAEKIDAKSFIAMLSLIFGFEYEQIKEHSSFIVYAVEIVR